MLKHLTDGFYPQFLLDEAGDNEGGSGGEGNQSSGEGDGSSEGDSGGEGNHGMIDPNTVMKKEGEEDGDNSGKKDGDGKNKAERPEFIHEKFWDAEKGEPRIESMAKAYSDLENKLGNNKKAPDEYKLELNDDLQKIFSEDGANDDPMLAWFKDYAKSNNFTQEMFNDALEGFGKSAADFLSGDGAPPAAPDPKEERGKLGKMADAIIENQTNFLGQLFKQGHVNEEQMQEILILTETAAGLNALQAVRNYYGDSQKIPQNLTPSNGVKSGDELRAMMADKKYGTDAEYTATVDTEYEKKYGTGNSGQSQQSPLY